MSKSITIPRIEGMTMGTFLAGVTCGVIIGVVLGILVTLCAIGVLCDEMKPYPYFGPLGELGVSDDEVPSLVAEWQKDREETG
jgi:uncharacterized membrane protein